MQLNKIVTASSSILDKNYRLYGRLCKLCWANNVLVQLIYPSLKESLRMSDMSSKIASFATMEEADRSETVGDMYGRPCIVTGFVVDLCLFQFILCIQT